MEQDTIAAISTAVSNSGIGIIRISGKDAVAVADRVYRSKNGKKHLSDQPTHTIHYGYIVDGGETVDEVLVMLMRGPKSFTAEDTVEVNCHGGVYAMKRVLDAVLKNGARPAEPGEFTKRAFLNGRIDLSQAESVMDVIQAKNEYALKSSLQQLKGAVRTTVEELRSRILYQTAFIESALDDPEHISLDGYPKRLAEEVGQLQEKLSELIASSENGRILKEGIRTVILGKPNAGKSSLLNALVGEERAIVTDIAGTTRDALEETIAFQGITLNLIDTAGIRETEDVVEKIGVGRAIEKAEEADLILCVFDAARPLDENDREILKVIGGKQAILLLNKTDLAAALSEEELRAMTGGSYPIVQISAKEQTGLSVLTEQIRALFYQGEISVQDELYITNARQKRALQDAAEGLQRVQESILLGMPEDFYSIDLLAAYEALGTITGETVGEDLVNEIFSRFCMGK
ncbi:MAG: tRNA uridine-5-carboxymethylaminomethyl(34) synthesis GTPase MnmE [Lachnospiraceae bacterium]|nr:tRNA uridine-5-carboxymethylaminomethyl(34) synthesis GTPase MnmE [Lachnospiraceae bacterium]